MKAEFLQLAPQLVVADVVKTAEYYRDYLGFEILGYWHDPPVFAMIRRGSVELQLGLADDFTHPKISNTAQRKCGLDLYITVDNIHLLFDEMNARDIKIVEPMAKRVYNMIEFAVEDCNGFKLVFGQDAR